MLAQHSAASPKQMEMFDSNDRGWWAQENDEIAVENGSVKMSLRQRWHGRPACATSHARIQQGTSHATGTLQPVRIGEFSV